MTRLKLAINHGILPIGVSRIRTHVERASSQIFLYQKYFLLSIQRLHNRVYKRTRDLDL